MTSENGSSANAGLMPMLEQSGQVFIGQGAKRDAQLLGLGLSNLSSRQKDDLDRAKRYAMEQSIRYVLNKQKVSHHQNQQKAAQMAQALSLMSRVYIGSVSLEVREDNIRESFSVFGPIKSINMSYDTATGHHKGFAFLEFEVPEAAVLAQEAMNGRLMGGRNLKVGRPSNMPQAQPIIEMVQSEAKKYHRVYVASVHPDLSESDLRDVFASFGNILRIQLAKHAHSRHRGFGYIEFDTAGAVKDAIDGMNNFDLGGQYLQVGRCISPPEALMYIVPSSNATQSILPSSAAIAAAAITAKIQAQEVMKKSTKKEPESLPPPPPAAVTIKREIKQEAKDFDDDAPPPPPPSNGDFPEIPPPPPPEHSPAANASPRPAKRRRGFEGFASAPPPKVVEPPRALPAPSVFDPLASKKSLSSTVEPSLGKKVHVEPTGFVPIEPEVSDIAPVTTSTSNTSKSSKNKKPKGDILSRIKLLQLPSPGQKANFGPAPKEISLAEFEEEEAANTGRLAITGPESSFALALRNDSQLAKSGKGTDKKDKNGMAISLAATGIKRRRKIKPPKERKPKLNTASALAAVYKAGAINDQIQAVNQLNDEATLASQENVEIRGNDARHMLMHKLMRTNRSTVMVLKNMVEAIDEELEEEIRDECSNYGTVTDVVIVEEKAHNEIRIFVRFADPTQAEAAVKVFDGRFFDGRTVSAQIYDQILFDHDDFTG